MPEYLSPGVFIEGIEIDARPIEGVSTSTAGFLGVTLRGPQDPRLITGLNQFKRLYGGHMPNHESNMAYAVDGFFKNGGRRCFIGRIMAQNAVSMTGDLDTIDISAIGAGQWGNRIAVKIEEGRLADSGNPRFKLTVAYWDVLPPGIPPVDPTDPANDTHPDRREPARLEVYDDLSADKTAIDYFETRINKNSKLIRTTPRDPANPAAPGWRAFDYIAGNGADGSAPDLADYRGRGLPPLPDGTIHRSGLAGFKDVDEISIVCAPDHHKVNNLPQALIAHCELLKDRFAVLHSRPSDNLSRVPGLRGPQDTSYAAFYFPWIKIINPLTNQETVIPPSGHITGIYAATDIKRGVHKAPANVAVAGATGLQFNIPKDEQDLLNPRGVNCLRALPGRGIRVWGARTLSTNTLWKYINLRRLSIFLEESIAKGTQWVVFEPNDHRLWARVRQTITQFLTVVWRDGAIKGTTAEDAFFVKCDRTTMTQDDIDNGRMVCCIGFAPVKPAEFVIFRVTQSTANSNR